MKYLIIIALLLPLTVSAVDVDELKLREIEREANRAPINVSNIVTEALNAGAQTADIINRQQEAQQIRARMEIENQRALMELYILEQRMLSYMTEEQREDYYSQIRRQAEAQEAQRQQIKKNDEKILVGVFAGLMAVLGVAAIVVSNVE